MSALATRRLHIRPAPILLVTAGASFVLYVVAFGLPYNLFAHVNQAPISLSEIAHREPLPAAAFLGAFLALFGLYALAYHTCRRHPTHQLAPLVLLCGLALALPLVFTYPIGATDLVEYVNHGEELAFHGLNPLVVPVAEVPDATFVRHSAFRHATPNYGPVWIWISALVVSVLGRESLALNLLGFKVVALTAYTVQAVAIYAVLRRRAPSFALPGLVFFAWNPLILYETAASGHNDATMMALALVGILLWERDRPLLMTAALTFSFLIKIPTALLLPLFLLSAGRRRQENGEGLMTVIPGGLVALALVAVSYLSLPSPLAALTNLADRSHLFTHSLPAIFQLTLRALGTGTDRAQAITRALSIAALGIWYVGQTWKTWKAPAEVLRPAYHVLLFLLLFVTPWFQPWYVTWLVALAALRPTPQAPAQAGLFSLTVIGSYVVYGFAWFWFPRLGNWSNSLGINLAAVATTYLIPWAYTAWIWMRARTDRG
jgi:hypothetical protein